MAKRLVKVAKEFNVGTGTIIEYLNEAGFDIDNKPSAKIDDEMYAALTKEFHGSAEIKELADQITIGNKPAVEVEAKQKTPTPVKAAPKTEAPKTYTPAIKVEEKAEEKETPVDQTETPEAPKIKVLGKIDLTTKKAKPKTAKKTEEKKEEIQKEAPVEEKVTSEVVEKEKTADVRPKEKEEVAETPVEKKDPDEVVRATAPQLKGLKILGKIETKKFEKPKKKEGARSEDSRPKRKRKRKKVTQSDLNKGQKGRQKQKREEVKEISQKEIEDKIKATLARISGTKGKKRQKIRKEKREEMREKQELKDAEKVITKLQLTEFVSVSELAGLMDVPVNEVIMVCMNLGVIVSINQRLDAEIIELVADEFGHEVEFISADEDSEAEEEIVDDPKDLVPRAPIVTVMGHVDHGKTSLLDFIRSTTVASGEAGGITQHIGAYEVFLGENKDQKITFLDTPGHEAFTAMRARGTKVTDIAIIIVAADDRIMPQTKEAISHAQAADVPMVFAINKIDKSGADPERIKQELASMNLLVEAWGGKYQSQDISAKTGEGIPELLDKIKLEAEILELKANPNRLAIGTVLESSLDKGRGYVTKLLVQHGTLRIGDPILAGVNTGRVKAMFNERNEKVLEAGPSTPVVMLGLNGTPQSGETFKTVESEKEAKQLATNRAQILREQSNRASKRISLDEIGRRLALGTFKELNIIVKADMDGSVEALSDSLTKLSMEEIQVNVIHKAAGQIIESDVLLAAASDAIIIGFQVRPSLGARKLAEQEGVELKHYSVIYRAIDEVKEAMEGMLEPTKEEKITCNIEVREVFKISKIGTIAGCFVRDGAVNRNTHIRVIRNGIVIFPTKEGMVGTLSSLKRFKDDVKEVKNGTECGISIANFNDIKVGDEIEGYDIIEIKRTLG